MIKKKYILKTIIFLWLPFLNIANVNSQNLIQNPGFESGIYNDYWSGWNGIPEIDSANVHSGNYAVKVATFDLSFYQNVPVSPGVTYTASVWVKNVGGATIYFGVKGFGGTEVKTSSKSTTYVKLSLSFTPAAGYDNAQIYVYKYDGKISYVDDFSMTGVEPVCSECFEGGGGNYYVKESGDDAKTGTSIENAWKTVSKVNFGKFKPGDVIHFEGNKTFSGTLVMDENDSGIADSYVRITSFGSGKAIIDGGSAGGLRAVRSSYIKIDSIIFSGMGRLTGSIADGIKLTNSNNIEITNTDISGFQHSGIYLLISHDVNINKVSSHDNGFAGIHSMGVLNGIRNKNIYIVHSKTYNNPGDPTVTDNHSGNGIITGETDDVLIEYCESYNNGWDMPRKGNGPVGIWSWNGNNIVIQNCISHDNKTSIGGGDGGGFDFDGGVTNSIIQYCLSYNNQGSAFGIFQFAGAGKWDNNTIRYCISENDGNVTAGGNAYLWNGSGNSSNFSNLKFYNNVIYNDQKACISFADHSYSNFQFYNNIFMSKGSAITGGLGSETFLGNCWWTVDGGFNVDGQTNFSSWVSTTGKEQYDNKVVGINVDPQFNNIGPCNLTDPALLKSLSVYKLKSVSLLIDAGIDIKSHFGIDPGTTDFFGNLLPYDGTFNIGIDETVSIPTSTSDQFYEILKYIYPNPCTDFFYVNLKSIGKEVKELQLVGLNGAVLKQFIPLKQQDIIEVRLDELPKGIYLVKIVTSEGIIVGKVVK